jgi:hypothetical protein
MRVSGDDCDSPWNRWETAKPRDIGVVEQLSADSLSCRWRSLVEVVS